MVDSNCVWVYSFDIYYMITMHTLASFSFSAVQMLYKLALHFDEKRLRHQACKYHMTRLRIVDSLKVSVLLPGVQPKCGVLKSTSS